MENGNIIRHLEAVTPAFLLASQGATAPWLPRHHAILPPQPFVLPEEHARSTA